MVQKYLNKISGPLLDRIDIHIEVVPVPFSKLSEIKTSENSETVRKRVITTREIQSKRFKDAKEVYANAQMSSKQIRVYCQINEAGQALLKSAMEKLGLSARPYDHILKVSRTIADLENCEAIQTDHLAEAIQYRSLDRDNWGN